MALSVKAYLYRNARHINDYAEVEPEIRRFGLDEGVATNYSYLERKVASIFPNLVGHVLKMHYQDAEGDYISFSSDEELMDALSYLTDSVFKVYISSNGTYHINVVSDGAGHTDDRTDSAMPGTDSDEKPLHEHVTCDGCQGSVRGYRYKCVECPDYDLCRACENSGQHPEHAMIRMVRPSPLPGFSFRPFMFGLGRGRGRGRHCHGGRGGHHHRHHGGGGHHGGHPHHWPPHHHRHHHHGDQQGEQEQQSSCESSAETGEHQEQESPAEQYLRTVGESVAAMLDDFGIDVHVDVENNGQRRHCAPSSPPSMDTEDNLSKGGDTAPEPVPEQGAPAPSDPTDPAPTEEAEAPAPVDKDTSSLNTEVKQAPCDECSESIGPVNQPSYNCSDRRGLSPESRDQGWTMLYPSMYPNPAFPGAPQYPMQQPPFQPVRPVPSDPYERGLAPHVIHALTQMKSMGFNNDGGWLSALLAAKNGDIDSTLESLKPNITGPNV